MVEVAKLFDLNGRSALITGATGALGSAAARALADAGAHVTIAGGNGQKLDTLASELVQNGASVSAIAERPSNETSADKITAAAAEAGGGIDVVVSASGMSVVKPILEMSVDTWDEVMDANARQSWLLCRSAGRIMTKQNRGSSIVLVSSVRSRFAGAAGTSAYGTSKAAIDMLTRSLATEWGPQQVRVNAIAPTVFRSELTSWLFEEGAEKQREKVLSRIPLGRLAEPDDFAGVLVFLASEASALMTGQILSVDGGFSCN